MGPTDRLIGKLAFSYSTQDWNHIMFDNHKITVDQLDPQVTLKLILSLQSRSKRGYIFKRKHYKTEPPLSKYYLPFPLIPNRYILYD